MIVDDEPNVLYSLGKRLRSDTLEVYVASTALQGIERVKQLAPDAVLLDVRLPDMSGLDAFEEMRKYDSRLPVVIITAHATTEIAIEAMKRGAFEYLLKPLDLPTLRQAIARAVHLSHLSRVPTVFGDEARPGTAADCIVGHSAPMLEVYKSIGRVALQDVTVLILGESGTGKELVARAIYSHSRRSTNPFLAINCAAIPEPLLESELFGHERGAFTGADRRRIGKFEQAHHGTIFLDEIGDMTLATQAKVLRLLQDGRFERIGGNETIDTDVRIIAATNQNLEQLVDKGRFREDLYYRLKVFTIKLPPLRDRMADVPFLVDHFVNTFSRELHKQIHSVPAEFLNALEQHSWPGNVRELQSAIKHAFVQTTGEALLPHGLPEHVTRASDRSAAETPAGGGIVNVAGLTHRLIRSGSGDVYRQVHAEVDRILLQEVLREVDGNQVVASQILGLSRTTLRSRLRAANLPHVPDT